MGLEVELQKLKTKMYSIVLKTFYVVDVYKQGETKPEVKINFNNNIIIITNNKADSQPKSNPPIGSLIK
jgi:hypothetical protein